MAQKKKTPLKGEFLGRGFLRGQKEEQFKGGTKKKGALPLKKWGGTHTREPYWGAHKKKELPGKKPQWEKNSGKGRKKNIWAAKNRKNGGRKKTLGTPQGEKGAGKTP